MHDLRASAHLDLLGRPLVQVDRLHPGDVDSQVAVDSGAADAHEDAEVPRGPAGTCQRANTQLFTTSSPTRVL